MTFNALWLRFRALKRLYQALLVLLAIIMTGVMIWYIGTRVDGHLGPGLVLGFSFLALGMMSMRHSVNFHEVGQPPFSKRAAAILGVITVIFTIAFLMNQGGRAVTESPPSPWAMETFMHAAEKFAHFPACFVSCLYWQKPSPAMAALAHFFLVVPLILAPVIEDAHRASDFNMKSTNQTGDLSRRGESPPQTPAEHALHVMLYPQLYMIALVSVWEILWAKKEHMAAARSLRDGALILMGWWVLLLGILLGASSHWCSSYEAAWYPEKNPNCQEENIMRHQMAVLPIWTASFVSIGIGCALYFSMHHKSPQARSRSLRETNTGGAGDPHADDEEPLIGIGGEDDENHAGN